jgi:hypothetical protein
MEQRTVGLNGLIQYLISNIQSTQQVQNSF